MHRIFGILGLIVLISSGVWSQEGAGDHAAVKSFRVSASYFIPNEMHAKTGKALVEDDQVVAFVQTRQGRVLFTPSGAYIGMAVPTDRAHFRDPIHVEDGSRAKNKRPDEILARREAHPVRTVVMKAGFDSNRAKKRGIKPRLVDKTDAVVSFFLGERENWRRALPTYKKLVYDHVWDGITLEYLGYMDRLEYRFILEPGSDPNQIVMDTGADHLRIGETGSGIFPTTSGVYGETQNGYGDAFVACFHFSCLAANLELWPGITALDFINCLNGNQMGSGRLRLEMTLSPKNCKISDVALMPKTTAIRTPIF